MLQNYDPLCTDRDTPFARCQGLLARFLDRNPSIRRALALPATTGGLCLAPATAEIRRITPEQRAAVLSHLPTGLHYKEIAARLGMNRSTVQKIANAAGHYRKRPATAKRTGWTAAELRARQIQALRATGLTHKEIADRLRLKRTLVSYYLSRDCGAANRLTTAHHQTAA